MLPLLLSVSALAQTFTLDPGNVLAAAPGSFYASGVGAPSVEWDPSQGKYIMVFETRTGPADASCPEGRWSLGAAASDDGYTWDVWPDAVVSPTPGTAWSCYAAQPSLVRTEDGTFHVFFKAGQGRDACAVAAPAWGCAPQVGIGKVSGAIQLDDDRSDQNADLEARLVEIDGEIDDLLADLHLELEGWLDLLEASSALQCVNYADICSPCDALDFNVTWTGGTVSQSWTLCQPFDFDTPMEIITVAGASGTAGKASLDFGLGGPTSTCTYKGRNNNDNFVQNIALGQCAVPADPTYIRLQITTAKINPTTVEVTLHPTNVQTWQGAAYDAIQALSAAAAAGDEDAVLADAPGVLTDLDELRAQLATLFQSADVLDLDLATEDLALAIEDVLLAVEDLEAERITVEDQIADNNAYLPHVDLQASQNGPALIATRASFPTAVQVAGSWYLQYQIKRNIFGATSLDGETFTATGAAQIATSTVAWAATELFSPSLICNDVAFAPDRFQTFVGGRQTVTNIPGDAVASGSIGDSIAGSGFSPWMTSVTTMASWVGNDSWRHMDVLKSGSGHRAWVTERDLATGKPVVRHASSGAIDTTGGSGRVCQ